MNKVTIAWYRVFQFCFYKASRLLKWRKPIRLEEPGCVLQLPEVIKRFGVNHVLFVTDQVLRRLNLTSPLEKTLETSGIAYTVFDSVKANPTIDMVEQARKAYLDNACQGFIAFGGGSVIDTAKAAAARVAKPRQSIAKMGGFLKVGKKLPPVFAVSTTAGTGSEVTVAAVVTDSATHHKYAVNDPCLIPVCAVLDPEITAGLPPSITAETGMDALAHAVEAYITWTVSKRCRAMSEEAVRLIFGNIERAYKDGRNMEARQNMLRAAFLAGDSFTRSGLTYNHAVAHTLSGLYNETHGKANAVLLPHVLEAFGKSTHAKLARLAVVAGLDVGGMDNAQASAAFIEAIRQLNREMGLPEKFDEIRREDIPQMARWALAEANPWYPVPKVFGRDELTAIIGCVMERESNMDKKELVKKQREFFDTGKTLDLKFRIDALKKLLNAVIANEGRLKEALYADLGKPGCEAYMTEIGLCRDELRFLIRHLPGWVRSRRMPSPLAQFAAESFVVPEPYGSALIISPWNYPVLLSIDPLAGAIAAGNTVVLKPSNYSPHVSEVLTEMLSAIYPPEHVSVVTGGRAENADLLEQKFDYIFFTGSVSVGRVVMEAASKHLTPLSLELGGKSPVIVDETANIPLTARRLAFGKFVNAGQTCVAPDYVYVHASKKAQLIDELKRVIPEFYPGGADNELLPRIVNEKHFDRLLGLMAGENAVVGGESRRETLKIAPTVLDNITRESPVMGEEIFGPIMPLLEYTSLDEVIRDIKDHPKPLAFYLFSENKAVQKRVLREVSFGGGCINETLMHLATPHMGFGGVGESGMGSYHGKLSFDTFTHYKSIVDKKTWIDLPIRYAPFDGKKEKVLRMFLK
jgi:aldehyde dehydrogenase (NAD+)